LLYLGSVDDPEAPKREVVGAERVRLDHLQHAKHDEAPQQVAMLVPRDGAVRYFVLDPDQERYLSA
jgi:hypothetical protein